MSQLSYSMLEPILMAAIERVKPATVIKQFLRLQDSVIVCNDLQISLPRNAGIRIIGFGKASAAMAQSCEEILGEALTDGLVITKHDHSLPTNRIRILEAGHPVPDAAGLQATAALLSYLQGTDPEDLIICLISGGGSALLEHLADGISFDDLQNVSKLLLGCGAEIQEMNAVRKHLSLVKGGQLARLLAGRRCISLVISDVIGDDLSTIASGPLIPDNSTFYDAWQVIEKYQLANQLPNGVRQRLENGMHGKIAENPSTGDPCFASIDHQILASNDQALAAAANAAENGGFIADIIWQNVSGEARNVARQLATLTREKLGKTTAQPRCLIFGGEPTVTLRGSGKGGRNQELALAFALAMKDSPVPYLMLSCGTDGTDGPTDAAGAWVSPATLKNAKGQNLSASAYLDNNDAYHFFDQVGGLIRTGATGTNVMDIGLILLPGSRSN